MVDNLTYGEEAAATTKLVHADPSSTMAWATVAVLFLLSVVSMLDRNIVNLLIAPIQSRFGLSDTEIGLLMGAAFAIPYGVISIPLGWAVDRFQRRLVIAASVAAWSLATAATGIARSFEALFAARAGVGIGEAGLIPSQQSMLSDIFPRERLALPLSIAGMGLKVGQGTALLIGATLTHFILPASWWSVPGLGTIQGWQLIFLIIAVPGLLLAPIVFAIREPRRRTLVNVTQSEERGFGAYLGFVRRNWRFFLTHHLGFMLIVAMSVAVTSWTPAFLIRVHGWPESTTGMWLGTALLLGPIAGMPLHGALADRLFQRGWTDIHILYSLWSALLAGPIGIAIYLMPTPELAAVTTGVFFFAISAYAALPVTALVSLLPSWHRGKAVSIVLLICGTGGSIIGPLAVATATDFLFDDKGMIGASIMVTLAVLTPLVAGFFLLTLRPFRALSAGVVA